MLPLFVASRYSFGRQRSRFIGVVSMVSLLGMALGVASLITVLAVMNGFAGELRDRILSLVAHIEVEAVAAPLTDWPALADRLQRAPEVIAAAPYIRSKALLGSPQQLRGAVLTAIDPDAESAVAELGLQLQSGSLAALAEVPYGVVSGALLARALELEVGDRVELTVPRLIVTPLGSFPRRKRFTLVGIFAVGAQLDSTHAYIGLAAGQKLLAGGAAVQAGAVQGLRLRLDDLLAAPAVAGRLAAQLGDGYRLRPWSESQGSLFAAVRMEKIMMTILLLSVVAVAAFNIISTLTMAVTEKRADIAVLRTLGAGRRSVMAIFMTHGLLLALTGIGLGALIGVLLALNISQLSALLEGLLGSKLFSPEIYFISDLPARLQWADVAMVTSLALLLSVCASVLPAWRAARVAPAEVLRYE